MIKNWKNLSGKLLLVLLPVLVVALGVVAWLYVPEVPHREPFNISVKVEDAEPQQQTEEASIPILSVDDLHKPLRLVVKDPKQPPEVERGEDKQYSEADKEKASLPVYEEKNIGPDIAIPSVPKHHFDGKPRIAIVIDDVGINVSMTERITALPSAVTMSFLPYSSHLQEQADKATAAGHELMLHMPMQPKGAEDPGPGALNADMTADDVREALNKALESFYGYDGVNNHMGSKVTSMREHMSVVMDVLKQRRVFFLDSLTSNKSVAARVAQEQGVPAISRDVFLDNDVSETGIRQQLYRAEQIAKRKGYAVAIGHPHASTIKVLETWIPDAEKRGVEIIPIEALLIK